MPVTVYSHERYRPIKNFSRTAVIQDNEIHFGRDVTEVEAFERNFEAIWNRRDNRVVQ